MTTTETLKAVTLQNGRTVTAVHETEKGATVGKYFIYTTAENSPLVHRTIKTAKTTWAKKLEEVITEEERKTAQAW